MYILSRILLNDSINVAIIVYEERDVSLISCQLSLLA